MTAEEYTKMRSTVCLTCGCHGLHACGITPQPAPFGTATSQPRCECHDCTQARAHPMVFSSLREAAIARLAMRKAPHLISELDIAIEATEALSHQIKEAVAAERKRCEQVVVDTTVDTTNPGQGISGWNQACAVIAERIRSGK